MQLATFLTTTPMRSWPRWGVSSQNHSVGVLLNISNQIRLTDNPANDANPMWQP